MKKEGLQMWKYQMKKYRSLIVYAIIISIFIGGNALILYRINYNKNPHININYEGIEKIHIEYKVANNETLYSISRKIFSGNHRYWRSIYRQNKENIKKPDILPEGIILKITIPVEYANKFQAHDSKKELDNIKNKSDKLAKALAKSIELNNVNEKIMAELEQKGIIILK